MICTTCNSRQCFKHNILHGTLSCEEFDAANDERTKEEEATRKYLDEHTKKSPNPSCGLYTVKEGRACDHITCEHLEPRLYGISKVTC